MRPAGLFLSRGRSAGERDRAKKLVSKTLWSRSEGNVGGGVFGAGAGKRAARNPGIVDEDIETAVFGVEVVVGGLVVGGFGDVELEHVGIDARGAQLLYSLLRPGPGHGNR